MQRKLYMTDIHGCYKEMIHLLKVADYKPGIDQLVIGGDMIDRGPDSALVLKQLMKLQREHPDTVICLRGNHEDMLSQFLHEKSDQWLSHGQEAIVSFGDRFNDDEFDEHLSWAITRPTMFEDDEYVYVHAGIVPGIPLMEQDPAEMMWMPYSSSGIRFSTLPTDQVLKTTRGRTVVYGHTPMKSVFSDGARICGDLGCGTLPKGKLALLNLTNKTYISYDPSTGYTQENTIMFRLPNTVPYRSF